MKDLNFFEPFFEDKKKLNIKLTYVVISVSAIVILIVGSYLYTVFKVNYFEKEISKQNKILNSKELKDASTRLEVKKKKLNLLNNYNNIVEKVDKFLKKEDKIDTKLIKTISNQVPQKLTFQVMNISDTLNIQGTSQDRNSIAEFEHNLKETNIFQKVHIDNITAKEGQGYSFNIICSFKEDDKNEAK